MAKLSSINRNLKRVSLTKSVKAKRTALKATIYDRKASPEQRFEAQIKLDKLPRNSTPARVHNRCQLTGRSKAYYRKFQLSRIMLREMASRGQLPGVVKASW